MERLRGALVVLGVLLITAVVATGCSTDDDRAGPSPSPGDAPTDGDGDHAPSDLGIAPVELRRIDVDLDNPIAAVAGPGDDTMLVAERGGTVRVVDLSGPAPQLSEPVLDISGEVSTESERGLLGIALNRTGDLLVISYTSSDDGTSHIDTYQTVGGGDDLEVRESSRREILSVEQPFPNHNGGHVEFGPGGMLYAGLGDGGSGGDPRGNAQDRSTLLGKILRLDIRAESIVPSDNPFVDTAGARPEIWLTGVRNPWRFTFDSDNGDLWIGDVGQDEWEEIDLLPAAQGGGRGVNLGWNLFEGTEPFDGARPSPGDDSAGPFVEPVFTYEHGPGCSITGGTVYRGGRLDGLDGAYLFSDFCDPRIRALTPASNESGDVSPNQKTVDGSRVVDLGVELEQVVSFATDSHGNTYLLSLGEGMFRLEAA